MSRYLVAQVEPRQVVDVCASLRDAKESARNGESVRGNAYMVQDSRTMAVLWTTRETAK